MKKTWFISDLHLHPSRPHLFTIFYNFIDDITDQAEALYILGDLFEFWIGDDIIDHPIGKPYLPVIEKLRALSDSGVKLYFIQGNRDFLAQDEFVKRIGATLLPDHQVIDLYGTPTLIMHGDTLCIDDKSYQRMRHVFRLKIIQKIYLMINPEKRSKNATSARKATHKTVEKKSAMILDVNQQEVERLMRRFSVSLLIHGHTHREAEHDFLLDGRKVKRIVLGDWSNKACYMKFDRESLA